MAKTRKTNQLTKKDNNRPNSRKSKHKLVTYEHHAKFSGPIPPPNILNQYSEDVRSYIINAAGNEQSHRHDLENKMINTDSKAIMIGSYTTSAVCIIAVVGGIFLVAINKDGIGVLTILAPIAIKTLQFLLKLGRSSKKEDDTEQKHA